MTVYVLYSQFTDDPSQVKGIYTSLEKAEEEKKKWNDRYAEIQEIELDYTYKETVSLN